MVPAQQVYIYTYDYCAKREHKHMYDYINKSGTQTTHGVVSQQ